MNKFTFLSVLLLLAWSVQAGIVEKTYYFSNPEIKNYKGFQQITFNNDLLTAKSGNPALSYHAVSLLLPPGEEAVSVEVIGENPREINGVFRLWPYQPSRPLSKNDKSALIINKEVYSSKSVYPSSLCGNLSTQYLNGYAFALTAFTPMTYIPAEGKVSYYSKITVKIVTKPSEKSEKALKNLNGRKDIVKNVLSLAQNKSMIKNYPEKKYRSDEMYEMMIITGQQYVNSFEEIKALYLPRGIRVKVVTKEYIQQNGSGQDLQEKIRNYIIQEYQQSGVEYILLGGDVEIIPYRGFYCYVQSGSGYSDNGIPADLYYSALDGNWNDDGDSHWGEPDEDDLLPDIAVARMPFSNSTDLQHMIHKVLMYQDNPVLGELRKPLLVGEHLYSNPETWGNDYLELLIGAHNDNGYTTIGIPEDYEIQKMYEENQNWSGNDLMNKINEGLQFVHHVGHANETYVAKWTNSDITNSNFSGANGVTHNYTIMQTHGCMCGSFDYNDCILEKMVTIKNFAVAVVGNSRYGWFNEGQTEGPAAHLHREMVDAMFHEKIAQIGKAFVESKIQTAPWVEAPGQWEEGALRWNFYDINILGDPAMSIWNDEPVELTVNAPSGVVTGTNNVQVDVFANGQPAENMKCIIVKDNQLVGSGETGQNGHANIVFFEPVEQPGDAYLIVSGYNSFPDTTEITFIPPEGAYLVNVENQINDDAGNGNGEIDNGEQILMSVEIANIGDQIANGVELILTTNSPWITITDSMETIGNVPGGDTLMLENAFAFDVAGNIPDQQQIIFTMQLVSADDVWEATLYHKANAPVLTVENMEINDNFSGNGNGVPDPGETLNLIFTVKNIGHNISVDANAILNLMSDYVTLNNDSVYFGDMAVEEEKQISFPAQIAETTPPWTFVDFNVNIQSGLYQFVFPYSFTIGIIKEDFETGDFSQFEWMQNGNAPWIIVNQNVYEGNHSAKSGSINNDQTSELSVTLICFDDSEISFARKVSSEANYDFLRFYIDDEIKDSWSGDKDWQEFSYNISQGPHTLKWVYSKDFMVSSGEDCAWLDNVVFPATTTIIGVSENIVDKKLSVYPNPNNGEFYINLSEYENAFVSLFDLNGRKIYEYFVDQNPGLMKIKMKPGEKGLYLLKVTSSNKIITKKVLIK